MGDSFHFVIFKQNKNKTFHRHHSQIELVYGFGGFFLVLAFFDKRKGDFLEGQNKKVDGMHACTSQQRTSIQSETLHYLQRNPFSL